MTLDQSFLPRRTSAFLVVVCLHIGIVYLFATGLASKVIQLIPPNMTANMLDPVRATEPPPQPPPPSPERFKIEQIVTPEFPIDAPEPPGAIQAVIPVPTPTPAPQPVTPPVVRMPGGVGKGFPNTDDYYPPAAVRAGQEGTAGVHVCVDERGRLTSEPALAESSRVASIDGAALRLARVGSGHYLPASENGKPVSSCYTFHVVFRLRN
jgi:protein TonB